MWSNYLWYIKASFHPARKRRRESPKYYIKQAHGLNLDSSRSWFYVVFQIQAVVFLAGWNDPFKCMVNISPLKIGWFRGSLLPVWQTGFMDYFDPVNNVVILKATKKPANI